jgi:predicted MFS family arabinose efflux permease
VNAYLAILTISAARWSYIAAFIARLPIAMVPLSLLILVEAATGSYAHGGAVSGAFALGSASSVPFWGRALDRGPHRPIIGGTSVISAAFLALALTGTQMEWGLPIIAGLALGVGLFFPPITPAMRVAWRQLVPESSGLLAPAYALDAVAVETLFVLGPLVVAGLYGGGPALPVIATCILLAAGGVGYSFSPAGQASGEKPDTPTAGAARAVVLQPGVLLIALVAAAMSVGFGQMDVALTSAAQAISTHGLMLGLMFAAVAIGSIGGGLFFGARKWRLAGHRLLATSLSGFGLGLAATGLSLWLASPPFLLLPILALAGIFISPGLLVMQQMIDQALPPGRTSEGQALLNAVLTAGGAAGMALGGLWADMVPAMAVFFAAAGTILGGAVIASWAGGRLLRHGSNLR